MMISMHASQKNMEWRTIDRPTHNPNNRAEREGGQMTVIVDVVCRKKVD